MVGLVLGELFNFGRHTVTQGLMALGLTEEDWSGWYRLFSRGRYAEPRVARIFFRETLPHTSPDEPYVVGVDGVQIPRSSLKMAGTSWLKAPRTPVFKVGIHRAQRFRARGLADAVGGGLQSRDSAALSARLSAQSQAGPRRATTGVGSGVGVFAVGHDRNWMRPDGAEQVLLTLADGAYDTLNFWRGLPDTHRAGRSHRA